MQRTTKILWVDDEIDLLKPHIIYLENKGYKVFTATNGADAVDMVADEAFDIVFLDENMPGYSGIETLARIKEINSLVPVVMITKSEEEAIMDEAIGAQMADYLIKPVNPRQILLSIKKNIDKKELVTSHTTTAYQSEFSKLGTQINNARNFDDWADVYKKITYWEMELSQSTDNAMDEVLKMQKTEAENSFARFVSKNYLHWMDSDSNSRPVISPDLFRKHIFPLLDKKNKVFVMLFDNMRYDQWKAMSHIFSEYYSVVNDSLYMSILPTATMYARNAIFAGLMPSEIKKIHPEYWLDDDNEDGGKNNFEEQLLRSQMARNGRNEKLFFDKITSSHQGRKLTDYINRMNKADLAVMVVNFIDMISHARTEMQMIRELAATENAYRSLTLSWFTHSGIPELLKELSLNKYELILTTDHGTINVNNPIKVVAERTTNTNLRYKLGRNLNYKSKDVFEIKKPAEAHLPVPNVSTSYIFATNNNFFAYPNNYNYYAKYYKDTFQHGGVSMEEMIIPFVHLKPRG